MHLLRAIFVVALGLGVAACADDMSDLRNYVERTKARDGGRIEPLPEFEPYETFTYDDSELRDPFTPERGFALAEEDGPPSDIEPDRDRRREPLERYPLDSLSMVGTLSRAGVQWGLVRSPDGTVHQVLEGNYVGQNHGQIIRVNPDSIRIVEIVPDGQGNWMERDAALGLGRDRNGR